MEACAWFTWFKPATSSMLVITDCITYIICTYNYKGLYRIVFGLYHNSFGRYLTLLWGESLHKLLPQTCADITAIFVKLCLNSFRLYRIYF